MERGLSRQTVATMIGVSYETLLAWESGRRHPRAWNLPALCRVLGITEARYWEALAEENCGPIVCDGCGRPL